MYILFIDKKFGCGADPPPFSDNVQNFAVPLFNLSTPFMRKVVDGGKKKNKIRRAIETKFYKLSKQAGAELGQAQLKLQLGFTSIKIDQLN